MLSVNKTEKKLFLNDSTDPLAKDLSFLVTIKSKFFRGSIIGNEKIEDSLPQVTAELSKLADEWLYTVHIRVTENAKLICIR